MKIEGFFNIINKTISQETSVDVYLMEKYIHLDVIKTILSPGEFTSLEHLPSWTY